MVVLASFNYHDPPMIIYVMGGAVALSLLIPIFLSRSILVGIFGGAISWGLIAFFVFGTEEN